MKPLLASLALALLLAMPTGTDTLFLPLLRGGPGIMVTGRARWEPDIGPVAHRRFALLEVICEDPFLVFRHNSESPHARTDAEGRFAFQDVEDGVYVLAISHPLFGWVLVWPPGENAMVLVIVVGESVEMGIVRVGMTHLWGE